jgi:formate dehydrogenase maturation protein FdhE
MARGPTTWPSGVPTPPVDDGRWQRRATRARRLAGERPAVAETLFFYAALAETQEALVNRFSNVLIPGADSFADRLDPAAALAPLGEVVKFVAREAPAPLAEQLLPLRDDDFDRWRHRVHAAWITGGREGWDANAIQRFVVGACLQPFAERVALAASWTAAAPSAPSTCAICTGTPVVAMLREQEHGSKRSLVCGFCLSEWAAPRIVCLVCGESKFESLPVFRAAEFDAVRIDVCEVCSSYVKTIDLTRDGDASPIVDDLATMPLDLWARDKGYRRIRANLLGV